MLSRFLISLAIASLGAGYASAQVADTVDPQSGNYLPGVDPLDRYDPRPSRPNPARVNRSIAQRLGKSAVPAPGSGTTAAQAAAPTGATSATKYPAWWPK